MGSYKFQLHTNGEPAHEVDHELADDLEALKTALSLDFDVEVSQGGRFVAHIVKGSCAPKREKESVPHMPLAKSA